MDSPRRTWLGPAVVGGALLLAPALLRIVMFPLPGVGFLMFVPFFPAWLDPVAYLVVSLSLTILSVPLGQGGPWNAPVLCLPALLLGAVAVAATLANPSASAWSADWMRSAAVWAPLASGSGWLALALALQKPRGRLAVPVAALAVVGLAGTALGVWAAMTWTLSDWT